MAHPKVTESPATRDRRGQLLPEVTLISSQGQPVRLSDFRGHSNLLIVTAGSNDESALRLADELAAHQNDLEQQETRAVMVLHSSPREVLETRERRNWPFMVLADEDGQSSARLGSADPNGSAAPALIIADRFGEIYAEYPGRADAGLPSFQEILDWLSFINSQCPECGAAEWLG